MRKSFESYLHFFWAGVVKQQQTGAVLPSQPFLISKMLAPIPRDYTGQLLELGAGSGAITLELADRFPKARILSCEINPALARHSRLNLNRAGHNGRVRIVMDPAQDLLRGFAANGKKPDFIISGIPLGNMGGEQASDLISLIHGALDPGGLYIQFQHSLLDRSKIKQTFREVKTIPVLLNFPPAVVYYARR